jgi:N-carbamoylputrescine amidase
VRSEPFELVVADGVPDSPARVRPPVRPPVRVGVVQQAWHPDAAEHAANLRRGVAIAVEHGASMVCLQELTLLPYCALLPGGPDEAGVQPEPLPGGPTYALAADLAREHGVVVHASLYEADVAVAPLGDTAIAVL